MSLYRGTRHLSNARLGKRILTSVERLAVFRCVTPLKSCPEDVGRCVRVFASLDGQEQGLVNSKVAACATKDFVHGVCVNEFEAVAKSASLASRRKNHHRSGRKREVQLQNLTQGRFKGQHRCDS